MEILKGFLRKNIFFSRCLLPRTTTTLPPTHSAKILEWNGIFFGRKNGPRRQATSFRDTCCFEESGLWLMTDAVKNFDNREEFYSLPAAEYAKKIKEGKNIHWTVG